jgi:hypothetical protein
MSAMYLAQYGKKLGTRRILAFDRNKRKIDPHL